MGRAPCCDKTNVKRGPWSPEEDALLKDYIQIHGLVSNWIALPPKAGLKRCGKSCRLRWLNYLRPDIKHGGFSNEEDRIILNLFTTIGSRWSVIAAQLPGRTDNDVKNYWNTKLKKKLIHEMNADSQRTTPHQQSDQFPILEPTFNYYNNNNNNNNNIPAHSFTSYYDQNEILSINSTTLLNRGSSLNEYVVPMNQFQENFMRFNGEACSSSDDASSTDHTGYNKETEQDHFGSVSMKIEENVDDLLQGYLCYGVDDHNYQKVEKSYGFYGGNSLDNSLEEIKQLISTNLCSSNMLVDENKTAGKVTYY